MLNILCLKQGTAYGPEYVNILFDMVRRNLRAGYPGRFVCLTDDPTGLDPDIQILPLPDNLPGWWGKLYMFKEGLFPQGDRVLFMDLDTVICGNLEKLVGYDGQFATLRDFYYPQQVGPAIISWKVGAFASSIWEEWDSVGRPMTGHGDLWWINNLDQGRFVKEIDILQDLIPGYFCSYKVDCHPYPPRGTAVVCFHGQPKPDNCGAEWVNAIWKIGGGGMSELEVIANTSRGKVTKNVISACQRDIPWLGIAPEHKGQMVIVAGGPSLANTFPEVAMRKVSGQKVMAVNGAAKWLNEHGITPDFHVVIDARPENVEFMSASSDRQFIASQCDPKVLNEATAPILFHLNTEGMEEILPKDRVAHLVSSGTTVGMAAIVIAYTQGYRAIHLHGFDSSYSTGTHHAYSQKQNDADPVVEAVVNGVRFQAAPWMIKQVQDFQILANELIAKGVVLTVAGEGLLPYVAKLMSLYRR